LELDPEHEFETIIIVKNNAAAVLRRELAKSSWQKELVNLGSVCDPYQPIEREKQITRAMLKEFKQFKNPVTIATKSPMVTRDSDIISELSAQSFVEVVMSISTLNEDIRKEIEPRIASAKKRLQAISQLRAKNIRVGVLLMPIIPFLNDSPEEIDSLYKVISEAGANFVIPGILYLMGPTRNRFLKFISDRFPNISENFGEYYKTRSPPKIYRDKIHKIFRDSWKKYKFEKGHVYTKTKPKHEQKTIDQWIIEKE
jgi:DNA repair photolyase